MIGLAAKSSTAVLPMWCIPSRLLKICPYDAYFLIFAKFLGFRRAPIGPG